MSHQKKSDESMDGRLKSNTLARRVADLTMMVNQMKGMAMQMERHRHDLLITLATMCKLEGFDVSVVPRTSEDCGVIVAWNKKDVRHVISHAEQDEIMFRVRQIELFGFKPVPMNSNGHSAQFDFKVR